MIEKIKAIAKDKKLHFIVGLVIGLIGGYFISPKFGLMLAMIAGILKEVRDKLSGRGTCELLDCVYTICGGLLAYIILLILLYIF